MLALDTAKTNPGSRFRLRRRDRKENRPLPPVRANAGIEIAYRRKLVRLVDDMHRSINWWVRAAYRANEPAIAQDAPPDASGFGPEDSAAALQRTMAELIKRWRKRFDDAADDLAKHFARDVSQRSDASLRAILKRAGFTVEFRLTATQRDILKATINQNVSLIKSIPSQYLTQVEGSVMRSVQTGRDLASLTKDLQDHYGVTKRRAAFIARDQNNKATAALNRRRQVELGIKEAVWMHSSAGKEPMPTHLKAGRERQKYEIAKGWFDPAVGKYILPGELPNCRCTSRAILSGFA